MSLAPSFDCFSLSTVDVETCSERERREAEGGRGAGREGRKEGGSASDYLRLKVMAIISAALLPKQPLLLPPSSRSSD